ncbi:MAG: DUF4886 domain-containing protein [Clostridia bacterium]|nr:DUF4886 domain-containing protein [Clostridia bacterium]
MKFLILGNSHSNDVCHHLSRVFNAQGYEQPYTIGFLYYSGCLIRQHVDFSAQNQSVYDYYRSNGDGTNTRKRGYTMQGALEDQDWDMIFLQPGKRDMQAEKLNLEARRSLEEYVNAHVPSEHVFAWHTSWPNPNDEKFFSDDWWRKPPKTIKSFLVEAYGHDPFVQFGVYTNTAKENILPDPTYTKHICTGAAIFYAAHVLKIPQDRIYRDYTHLSDFGRIMASYTFYAQFTGKPIEEVKLDMLPAQYRQAHYVPEGDLILDAEMKEIIKTCANYALEYPWEVPAV